MSTSISPISTLPHKQQMTLAVFELAVSDGQFQATCHPHATDGLSDAAFDAGQYSSFKYGDHAIAEYYATFMTSILEQHLREQLGIFGNEPIVLIGTPFKVVPNAARLLTSSVERRLRQRGFSTSISTIYQHRLAEGDYGKLSTELRDARNRQKKRFYDAADFSGKHVVLIDDVRITGSIERSVLTMLDGIDWMSLTTLNLLRLDPEAALRNPAIEDSLNHARVKGLDDIAKLMEQPDNFVLTTRTVKFILESDQSELHLFLLRIGRANRIALYNAAIDDGYADMERYKVSIGILSQFYTY